MFYMGTPAIFLDRDGTIVEEVNYLHRPEQMRLFAHTATALRSLRDAGYLLVVVTNQSGIGRGIYTENDMRRVHKAIQHELGDMIDGFYHCPHLPCDGCDCRKPGLKMIRDAERDLNIDLKRSWIVGDKKIDVETGKAAEMRTALVLTGYGRSHKDALKEHPDVIADHLGDAAKEILRLTSAEVVI
jgi:D-glycero-D-manno-heptose 1,7-bisphosphate phosphatase